jgi:hypothetical protein
MWYFGTVPTMWYFYAFHFITQYKKKDKNLEGKEPVTFTVEPNTIILVFVASPLNTHLQGVNKQNRRKIKIDTSNTNYMTAYLPDLVQALQ